MGFGLIERTWLRGVGGIVCNGLPHADVWETLFVYVDAETELKLFLDDLSYVKYDYTPPATTTTELAGMVLSRKNAVPSEEVNCMRNTAVDQEADHGRQDHCGRCFGSGRQ